MHAAAIFRSAVKLAPAYAWVALLHYAIPGIVAIYVTHVHLVVSSRGALVHPEPARVNSDRHRRAGLFVALLRTLRADFRRQAQLSCAAVQPRFNPQAVLSRGCTDRRIPRGMVGL